MSAVLLLFALAAQSSPRPVGPVDPGKKIQLYRPDLPHQRDPRRLESVALRMGGGKETEAAVAESLEALARMQAEDGSWDPPPGGSRQETTSLALLAFHNTGYSLWDQKVLPRSFGWRFSSGSLGIGPHPPHHLVFRRGISWLRGRQQADGFIGTRTDSRSFRDHALATRLLCDVYGYSHLSVLQDGAERAIAALAAEPFPSTADDPEGAAWAESALQSAALVDLRFDRALLDRLVPGIRLQEAGKRRKAAVDLLLWCRLRWWQRLPADLVRPPMNALPSADLRDWLLGSWALRHWDAPEGPVWKDWNTRMKGTLLPIKPEDAESWALRALTLEVYYGPWIYWGR